MHDVINLVVDPLSVEAFGWAAPRNEEHSRAVVPEIADWRIEEQRPTI